MNISNHNLISPNEILSDVLVEVMDEGFKDHSRGYYVSQIQQALEELAFDTMFDERTEFVDVPDNLRLEMPKGAFNIRQLYLIKGDKCDIANSQIVYWKRNYYTNGNGYLSRDKVNNGNDPFYPSRGYSNQKDYLSSASGRSNNIKGRRYNSNIGISNLYYFNIQNGMIMLSSNSTNFNKLAIVFNGTGVDIGEAPFIPGLFRQAIKGWVVDKALKVKIAKSSNAEINKWQLLYTINQKELRDPFRGTWNEAQYRAKTMDSKEREDLKEYIGRLNY